MQDLVDAGIEQVDIVADHDQSTFVVLQEVSKPHDRIGVQVVGGLVEQQGLRAGEQDPSKLNAPALASRQGPQWLTQQPGRNIQG